MRLSLKSFTLVEVMLVSSLTAILGIAVFQSFNNGFKLWNKAQLLNRGSEVGVFLDKMGEDLRSAVVISGVYFKGRGMQLSFPAIVITEADPKSSRAKEGLIDQIGGIEYRFDPAEQIIYRRQSNYAQVMKGQWPSQESPVALGIHSFEFHYQVPSDKGLLLKNTIDEVFPLGVLVELSYSDDSGQHRLKRFLPIPVGR